MRGLFASGWTTRFAPAPTGYLHLGHVASAIWVWGMAQAFGGRVLLRIEDHDRGRSRAIYDAALLEDLAWLGFEPAAPPVRQADRGGNYARALARLEGQDVVYPCRCSRRDVQAEPAPGRERRYPGTCRTNGPDPEEVPMRRVRLDREEIAFDDLRLGPRVQVPADQCGDLLVRDRAGQWTYQLAATVDDHEQGIDIVIRGEDLLESTGRQIQLGRLLGRERPPRYLHHPLILRDDGVKLSKSDGDTGVRELREQGWTPERVLGAAASAVALIDGPSNLCVQDLGPVVGRSFDAHRR